MILFMVSNSAPGYSFPTLSFCSEIAVKCEGFFMVRRTHQTRNNETAFSQFVKSTLVQQVDPSMNLRMNVSFGFGTNHASNQLTFGFLINGKSTTVA